MPVKPARAVLRRHASSHRLPGAQPMKAATLGLLAIVVAGCVAPFGVGSRPSEGANSPGASAATSSSAAESASTSAFPTGGQVSGTSLSSSLASAPGCEAATNPEFIPDHGTYPPPFGRPPNPRSWIPVAAASRLRRHSPSRACPCWSRRARRGPRPCSGPRGQSSRPAGNAPVLRNWVRHGLDDDRRLPRDWWHRREPVEERRSIRPGSFRRGRQASHPRGYWSLRRGHGPRRRDQHEDPPIWPLLVRRSRDFSILSGVDRPETTIDLARSIYCP